MIDAKQLRIGNWVKIDDLPTQVDKIDDDLMLYQGKLQPIELSPTILERCGFEGGNGVHWLNTKENGVYYAWDEKTNSVNLYESSGEGGDYGVPITTLHHLQNSYYFNTGKELILKL